MGYFTTIHIVTIEFPDQSLVQRMWYWDVTEAKDMYQSAVDEVGESRIVTLYSIDVQDTINERVDELMKNRHSSVTQTPLQELRSNRPAPSEDVTWGELEFRPNGEFYIERLKASTSEYWPYSVEPYGDFGWRVIDDTSQAPIGIVKPGTQNESFKAIVNGYSQIKPFTNLKAAVIHIATEYNGD
jgi:hypothetical protein